MSLGVQASCNADERASPEMKKVAAAKNLAEKIHSMRSFGIENVWKLLFKVVYQFGCILHIGQSLLRVFYAFVGAPNLTRGLAWSSRCCWRCAAHTRVTIRA